MIAMLKGTVAFRGNGFLIVDVAGVGYKVTMPEMLIRALPSEVMLYTHEVQRDDGRELFGFENMNTLELFWRLTTVSGVGPKSAQKIANAGTVDVVKSHIMKGDVAFLSAVPGIGKKTAQKIILELSGIIAEEGDASTGSGQNGEEIDALMGLGYTRKQADDALKDTKGSVEDRIRAALKSLSR